MAGLDGIKNEIDPGPAMDKDLYDLPKEELKQIPTVCGSLREALENLDMDRAFLKNGGWPVPPTKQSGVPLDLAVPESQSNQNFS